MIKLYLQKLFVNEIGFMNQQMAVVAVWYLDHIRKNVKPHSDLGCNEEL